MHRSPKTIDYLNDTPLKVLISICLPLIGVNVVLAFTSLLTNALYSHFVGEQVFSVMGYLSAVTTSFGSIISGIMFAAWIKIAHHFSFDDKMVSAQQMFNGISAIILVEAGLAFLLVLFTDPILRLLSIPEMIYKEAKIYYVLTILTYLPVALAAFCLTIVNGTSSASRLFWVNIMVVMAALTLFYASRNAEWDPIWLGPVVYGITFVALFFGSKALRYIVRQMCKEKRPWGI